MGNRHRESMWLGWECEQITSTSSEPVGRRAKIDRCSIWKEYFRVSSSFLFWSWIFFARKKTFAFFKLISWYLAMRVIPIEWQCFVQPAMILLQMDWLFWGELPLRLRTRRETFFFTSFRAYLHSWLNKEKVLLFYPYFSSFRLYMPLEGSVRRRPSYFLYFSSAVE